MVDLKEKAFIFVGPQLAFGITVAELSRMVNEDISLVKECKLDVQNVQFFDPRRWVVCITTSKCVEMLVIYVK